ncbi:MAG: hypothetical protein IPO81_09605 [Kouleothrix sp.]|nr:hypothetical protein [Kouleothrix sp.]
MPGVKSLRRIQLGKESTPGSAVAATTRWRGTGVLKDERKIDEVDEDVGILGGTDRTNIPDLGASIDIASTPLTFEQFQYILAMAMGGPTTGSADGAGSDKIYTTTIPTTALPTLQPYTVEGGDNAEVEFIEYAICSKFDLTGAPGKAVQLGATLNGRQVQRLAGGFSAATLPTVEDALFGKSKVYLDAIGGTSGTTQVQNAVLGYKLNFSFPTVFKKTADGQLYFSFPQYVDQEIGGEITFEHDTIVLGASGAKLDWRAQTPKLLQIKIEGANVTTPGTAYSKKTIIINLPIKWKVANPLSDMNRNDTVKMTFRARYNTTAGTAGNIIVVNELSALP